MPTSSLVLFQPFIEKIAEKVFNIGGDTLVVALCAAAHPPSTANAVLTDLTVISYTNLSARGVTITSSAQTAGVYKLVLAEKVLTASGNVAAFRYVVLYDDTAASDDLIGYIDYGEDMAMIDTETFTITFHPTNGALTFTIQ